MTANSPLNLLIRDARRARGMTQKALAEQIGCSQPAICKFEHGEPGVFSHETLRDICARLNVAFYESDSDTKDSCADTPSSPLEYSPISDAEELESLQFCPNFHCVKATRFCSNGKIVLMPAMYMAPRGLFTLHCTGCGAELSHGCRDKSCVTPLVKGAAFCYGCGTSLVEIPESLIGSRTAEDDIEPLKQDEQRAHSVEQRVQRLSIPKRKNQYRERKGQK